MTPARGTPVMVHEPGIKPWPGTWQSIKPPRPTNRKGEPLKQWVDVRRPDGLEYAVPLEYVEVLP